MVRPARTLLRLAFALAIVFWIAASPVAAESEWQERQTEHLTLRYAPGDVEEVGWYGVFVEDSYRYVSDIFGHQPRPGIVLTFHADEASYVEMNPLAGREEAVLAHAKPSTREIGLALWRLRKQSEPLRRDAIRHELTHVVLGEISNNRLPIAFHEGIAQYLEQDGEQRAKLVRSLRRAVDNGQLLSFADLNRQRAFLSRAAVSYPQSYSMVAFLNDRFGFGHVARLVAETRDVELDDAAQRTFGQSMSGLEEEWRGFLPSFLDGTWSRNDLDLWEMAEPRRFFSEGHYTDAQPGFERAARLFEDLGRAGKLAQARDYLTKSESGRAAIDLTHRGAFALEQFNYAFAADLLGQASAAWGTVGDRAKQDAAGVGLQQAHSGMEAQEQLDEARALVASWRLGEARTMAFEAGSTFAELGDADRSLQAEGIMAEARETQTRLGMAAIGGGAVGLVTIGAAWGLRRRQLAARPQPVTLGLQERDWSL